MDIIEEILDKYFDEEHEYYHRYREDEENMTEKDAADVLGDGWTVPVIAHIFSFMKF